MVSYRKFFVDQKSEVLFLYLIRYLSWRPRSETEDLQHFVILPLFFCYIVVFNSKIGPDIKKKKGTSDFVDNFDMKPNFFGEQNCPFFLLWKFSEFQAAVSIIRKKNDNVLRGLSLLKKKKLRSPSFKIHRFFFFPTNFFFFFFYLRKKKKKAIKI